ncbi:hypothetical protein [Glycomyces sp. NPDC048151]|uniref:hypothetical protein n=1 Tax=Glycomyces sp. NPDC048151 TaxID=3364002 RepID=UPI00371F10A1
MAYNPPPHYNLGGPSEPQQPQSAPPSYSPLQPQYDAGYAPQSPVSVPPPTAPVPAQPMYGTQPLLQPPPPAAPRKSPIVAVLATVMAVALAGAAVSIALWLSASGDLEDVEARVSDRDEQISQLEEDLEAAQAQVSELEGPAAEAEALQACIDDLNDYYNTEPESEEETAALSAATSTCDGLIDVF